MSTATLTSTEALVQQLTELAEAQRAAALKLDVKQVTTITKRRGDLAFALRVELSTAKMTPSLRAATHQLKEAEERLRRSLQTVLGAIRPLGPDAPAQGYTAQGTMRGV